MRIFLAQENPIVGDLKGNFELLRQTVAKNAAADLIVFPELFLTGYPPQDLLLRRDFLDDIRGTLRAVQDFTKDYPETAIVLGTPWSEGEMLFNSAVVLQNGVILGIQHKRNLTRFRLFSEPRYFQPGNELVPIEVAGTTLGICLGLELNQSLARKFRDSGCDVLINPVAIPFQVGHASQEMPELGIPLVRVGQVGANDSLIFAGGSMVLNKSGECSLKLPKFETAGSLVDLRALGAGDTAEDDDETAQIFQALVLGLKDYVRKNRMSRVIIGLSGGLDSAVSAVIAAKALGAENVWGITQPGPYSSPSSVEDARGLAENLKIRFDILPITELYQATLSTLDSHFAGTEMNVAEENIQARLRGNLLMALSNKFGGMVLTNSNKSELAVGYCTLYGDMSGGLAVLADVYKTQVYQLAHYINRQEEVIPWNTIKKPPSAELRPDQRDDETLPPYEILDAIIEGYLDEGLSPAEIIDRGYDRDTVQWVVRTIENNEYKRRQAALILRVTTPILGEERKMPLTAIKGV